MLINTRLGEGFDKDALQSILGTYEHITTDIYRHLVLDVQSPQKRRVYLIFKLSILRRLATWIPEAKPSI